jgi:hypothetical protein
MKLAAKILFVLSLFGLAACGNEPVAPQVEEPDGLQMETLDDSFASGTYRVDDTVIRFEVMIANGVEHTRFLDRAGTELFRSEIIGKVSEDQGANDVKWTMWHYGVPVDTEKTMDVQPEMNRWVNSQEAQLVASMWRDLAAKPGYESGPLNALFRYGVHLEEAMAFDHEGLEDSQEALCSCYGKCGPGCFSVGSNWYCTKHDCCCRTYGSAACYSWCFAYPKCPAAICY